MDSPLYFAVLGDVHGHYDNAWLALHQAMTDAQVPLGSLAGTFLAGDVEALRNEDEAEQVHGPAKFRTQGEFPRVVTGEIDFSIFGGQMYLTGGNHECWAAFDADGGLIRGAGQWAPGVIWLGRAGVLTLAGLRVAFLSGIHSPAVSRGTAAQRPRPREPHVDRKRRTYWVDEELATVRRTGMKAPVDLLITHDWPSGVGTNRAGQPAGDEHVRALIEAIRPTVSCHGHMHHPLTATIASSAVHCLGHMNSGPPAVALFSMDEQRAITRIY